MVKNADFVLETFRLGVQQWIIICRPSLSDLQQVSGLENVNKLSDLADWAKSQQAASIEKKLQDAGIAAAISLNGQEILNNKQVNIFEAFARTPKNVLFKGFPFQLKHTAMTIWGESPEVGEHTQKFVK